MSNRPMPAHHKTIRVGFEEVEDGYSGNRTFIQAGPGLWQIVSATTIGDLAPWPTASCMIALVVAPARVAP